MRVCEGGSACVRACVCAHAQVRASARLCLRGSASLRARVRAMHASCQRVDGPVWTGQLCVLVCERDEE